MAATAARFSPAVRNVALSSRARPTGGEQSKALAAQAAPHGPALLARKLRDRRRGTVVPPADLGDRERAIAIETLEPRQDCGVERHGGRVKSELLGRRGAGVPPAQLSRYTGNLLDERPAVNRKMF